MKKWMIVTMMATFIYGHAQVDACEKLKPNELSNLRIQSIYKQNQINISLEKKERTLKVNHEVKGKDVFIECIIPDFTFTKEKVGTSHQDGEGHLVLYVDGNKVDRIFQPAFIVKGLPTGKHQIKLELVRNDHQPYGLEEEFSVLTP